VNVLVCLEAPSAGRAARAALDLACTLATNTKVFVISAGGPATSAAIGLARQRAAVARIIHLDDPALDKADFMNLGLVLAHAARHVEANLVLAGERSDQEGQGLVPAAIAHHLKAHLISRVQAIVLSPAGDAVDVTARAGGQICKVSCPLPLVVTMSARTTTIAATNAASSAAVETIQLAQLGLDADRLVPRPDLLGALVPAPAGSVRTMTPEEASAALLSHR